MRGHLVLTMARQWMVITMDTPPTVIFITSVLFGILKNNNTSSLTELTTSKNLIQILDLMGRETTFKSNTTLIYVYDDGSIEKVFTIE